MLPWITPCFCWWSFVTFGTCYAHFRAGSGTFHWSEIWYLAPSREAWWNVVTFSVETHLTTHFIKYNATNNCLLTSVIISRGFSKPGPGGGGGGFEKPPGKVLSWGVGVLKKIPSVVGGGWFLELHNFSCSFTRNIASHSMKNLTFHSLLIWKMIILPILTIPLIHFSLKGLGECTFWTWEWKGWNKLWEEPKMEANKRYQLSPFKIEF